MVIVIGRGHSGTRVISQLLFNNGFRTGQLNPSFDMVPPEEMYCAAKLYSQKVKVTGDYEWNFDAGEVMPSFDRLVRMYLRNLLKWKGLKYFKLPETTLCYPWIIRMFPKAYYIHWIRDPRDFGTHLTDQFYRWHMKVPQRFIKDWTDQGIDGERVRAAISCKYQWDIVEHTFRPHNFIRIRYEDFCKNQKKELGRLSEFLGAKLNPVDTRTDSVAKWKKDPLHFDFPFLKSMLNRGGYF